MPLSEGHGPPGRFQYLGNMRGKDFSFFGWRGFPPFFLNEMKEIHGLISNMWIFIFVLFAFCLWRKPLTRPQRFTSRPPLSINFVLLIANSRRTLFIYLPLKGLLLSWYLLCRCYNEQENKSPLGYRKIFQKSLITLIFVRIKLFFEQDDPKTIFNFDDRHA